MKIEYANMRNKIETLARVNEEARVAHQNRFDIVMKRFTDDSLRQQQSAERIAQKIRTDIEQMNNEKIYLDEQVRYKDEISLWSTFILVGESGARRNNKRSSWASK